jgi:hypothetical protein
MKTVIMLISILVNTMLVGCSAASPNLLFVEMRGIKAQGAISGVFRKHEEINSIGIDIRELSEIQLHDLWVGLDSTNQTPFAEITEDAIKKIGVFRGNPPSAPSTKTGYFVCGYKFIFDGGQFASLMANQYQYSFPPKEGNAFVKFGSRKNGASLSLPCSVEDFEKVFGKPDKITRGFSW